MTTVSKSAVVRDVAELAAYAEQLEKNLKVANERMHAAQDQATKAHLQEIAARDALLASMRRYEELVEQTSAPYRRAFAYQSSVFSDPSANIIELRPKHHVMRVLQDCLLDMREGAIDAVVDDVVKKLAESVRKDLKDQLLAERNRLKRERYKRAYGWRADDGGNDY